MRMLDLSTLIAPSPEGTPPFERTDIAYSSHAGGAAQAQAILKVPPSVFRHGEGWATFVVDSGKAALSPVTIGHRGEAEVEILSGLAPGAGVAVHPGDRVKDGARVEAR